MRIGRHGWCVDTYSPYARCTPLGKQLNMSGETGGGEMQVRCWKEYRRRQPTRKSVHGTVQIPALAYDDCMRLCNRRLPCDWNSHRRWHFPDGVHGNMEGVDRVGGEVVLLLGPRASALSGSVCRDTAGQK